MDGNRFALLAAVIVWLGTAATSAAGIPPQLGWQGVALDTNNVPLADGIYTFHFAIYSDDVGGDSVWGETQGVDVENGVMNVLLGRNNPIPDSAFSESQSFLQVQFESQAPYVPRTRIVSVGYAFRTGSVGGAEGGTITSNVNVEGTLSATGVAIPPAAGPGLAASEAGPPVLELSASATGGQLDVRDEADNSVVNALADPDGEGGVVLIASDPGLTKGITLEGNADGSGEPRFSILGSAGALEFDLSTGGDLSLVLPTGSVTASEILDEPGVATGAQPGAITDIRDDYAILTGATATFPAPGYVVVIAEGTFRNHMPFSWLDARLVDNGSAAADWYWDPGDVDFWYDQRQSYVYSAPVSEGTHSYELHVRQTIGKVDAADARLTVIYLPTSYGSVVTSAPLGAGGSADTIQAPVPTVSAVDLGQERALAVAANQARIETEIAAMEMKMVELRTALEETRNLIERER